MEMVEQTNIKKEETVGEFLRSLVLAFCAAYVLQTLFFQPFIIPSGSMKPNLRIRDCLVVSKFSFGYSQYSFPWLAPSNLFKGRIFQTRKPQIGDVVVFRGPKDPDVDYIKRVVGLPGDEVQMREGVLYINGKECPVTSRGEFSDDLWESDQGELNVQNPRQVPMYEETLPNGKKHLILKLDRFGEGRYDNTEVYKVPEGHYFMMGDNRDESGDSRVQHQIGYVPEDHLVGEAKLIWFSTTASLWNPLQWLTHIRFSRLFKVIE